MRIARWVLAGVLLSSVVQAQPGRAEVLRVVPSADLTQLDPRFRQHRHHAHLRVDGL